MKQKKELTKLICVYGIVQGVGFRPFVDRTAQKYGVKGSVSNKGSYVEIYALGLPEQLETFCREIEENPPERSTVLRVDVRECENREYSSFEIIESEHENGDIFVSPDIATCEKCERELFDPKNRRYLHPFINCTACGPRLTILDAMPYDRERTSMKKFPMCPQCEWEYTHSETRRYDAQPVCCPDCGPTVSLIDLSSETTFLSQTKEKKDIEKIDKSKRTEIYEKNEPCAFMQKRLYGKEAITGARQALAQGKIIAIKGIGGFHLCCDASNEESVARLRERKKRPAKPFAVMMKNMAAVERECFLQEKEQEILEGHQKPILLLERRESSRLAASVAPDNPNIGVMLPYAPIQMLLFQYDDEIDLKTDMLVMTSGNVSGAPICRTEEDAVKELGSFCDLILTNDRDIRLRADDSVMDFYGGKPYMIRRSRGYAPLPFMMSGEWKGMVLAVGGELKNTFCIGRNQLFYPSPYVGDMSDVRTVQALQESIVRMEELLETEPVLVACDLHPRYNTTVIAEEMQLPVFYVQHHYAHILSCMAENDCQEKVIGVSFDGTGYGTDGTIWGGEIFLADLDDFERISHIQPFAQVGGDSSSKEGWRIAVSMINALFGEEASKIVKELELCEEAAQKVIWMQMEKQINCVLSTSAGRLFDAVSAIMGIRKVSTFEGEASMALEFAAEHYERQAVKVQESGRPYEMLDGKVQEMEAPLPTDALVRELVLCRMQGEDPEKLAFVFHKKLAESIVEKCVQISCETGVQLCALSGGVFQNKLLLRFCEQGLSQKGLVVLRHSMVPPNDGGIALGQAVAAMHSLSGKKISKIKNNKS